MKRTSLVARAGTLLCAGLLAATMAHAQASRTWVSGVGDDVNPCSRTAPCKTFPGAISKTAAGGEIDVLDPGSYGAVTITKAITINGNGNLAGILSAGTNAIIINAGVNDKVVIRNIDINGFGTGLNAIRYLAGRQVVIENVTITGYTGRGIDVQVPSGGTLNVRNVSINNAATGVFTSSVAGSIVTTLDNVNMNALTTGVELSTNSFAMIRDSIIDRCTTGVFVSASGANANIDSTVISFNGTGVNVVANAAARISDSDLYTNTTGVATVGTSTYLQSGNRVSGNGASAVPTGAIPNQ